MKREVERERKIPAFSIGVGELEVLWGRMVALFDDPKKVYGSITITLPSEKLEFDDIEELKKYPNLKGRITKFSFYLSQSQSGRRVSMWSSSLFDSQSTISATGESEAWCAGAIEAVYSFLQSYKVWYRWFVAAPVGWFFIVLGNAPILALLALPKGTKIDNTAFIGWLAILVTLGFLYIFKGKLFPASTLRVTNEESFIRRHSPELSLIIALVSAALTILGWYLGR